SLDAAEVGAYTALYVVGMQDRLPTRLAVLPSWKPGVLVPALVIVEVAIRSGGPHNLRHGIGQLAELCLAAAYRLLEAAALDQVAGMTGVYVEQSLVPIRHSLWQSEVGGKHPQNASVTALDGRGLHGAVACGSSDRAMRLVGWVKIEVLNDDAFS